MQILTPEEGVPQDTLIHIDIKPLLCLLPAMEKSHKCASLLALLIQNCKKLMEEVVLQDTLVDIRPFVRPLPDIEKGHKGAVACRAMRSADEC